MPPTLYSSPHLQRSIPSQRNDLLQENTIGKGNELGSQRLVCSFTPHNSYHHKYRRIETEFAPQKERNVLDAIGETGKDPSPQIGVIISPIRPN